MFISAVASLANKSEQQKSAEACGGGDVDTYANTHTHTHLHPVTHFILTFYELLPAS